VAGIICFLFRPAGKEWLSCSYNTAEFNPFSIDDRIEAWSYSSTLTLPCLRAGRKGAT
jgi:hypothetical protein